MRHVRAMRGFKVVEVSAYRLQMCVRIDAARSRRAKWAREFEAAWGPFPLVMESEDALVVTGAGPRCFPTRHVKTGGTIDAI